MNDKIEYESIMYSVLKKYKLYYKRDDYIDLCYIGYTKALNTFDEAKGTLKSYIYNCVENEILSELRKQNAQKRQREECSYDMEMDNYGHTYIDMIPDDVDLERDIICVETNRELCEAVNKLPKNELFIISHLFELNEYNYTPAKVCKILNITTEQMEDMKNEALAKLKDMLGDIR